MHLITISIQMLGNLLDNFLYLRDRGTGTLSPC